MPDTFQVSYGFLSPNSHNHLTNSFHVTDKVVASMEIKEPSQVVSGSAHLAPGPTQTATLLPPTPAANPNLLSLTCSSELVLGVGLYLPDRGGN